MPRNPLIFWAWFALISVGVVIALINQFHMLDEYRFWTSRIALFLTVGAVVMAFPERGSDA